MGKVEKSYRDVIGTERVPDHVCPHHDRARYIEFFDPDTLDRYNPLRWAIANETEGASGARDNLYAFHFGAYGDSRLLVWARSVEAALEEAGSFLADHWPGHIVSEPTHTELCKEACEDAGLTWPPPEGFDVWGDADSRYRNAIESAESDLTYTESGWLTSYEWTVDDVEEGSPLWVAAVEASPCYECKEDSTCMAEETRYCDQCVLDVYQDDVEALIWWTIEVAEGY
jgi:hypothetical protein